ncbi:Nif3-like dinuclear metal center hexameric protein [Microlunatus soli]|uniref:GTP cyclohydrolase 1 type 2 homolog n=1 Tax=Microlunatus soli TaxID=630515 RepID=A0A1H1Y4C9_9ACTN|nr:Nif3-like dinuclear metal center hexameric protein [Microlunatus soli]SDT16245.1 dinuclear metal center protein, YbgI/SA1388 family [Microlunatus soli]
MSEPTPATPTIDDVRRLVERRYPIDTAEAWDRVGPVTGEPTDRVTGILLTVDVTDQVIEQSVELGANLIIAHHPLLLRGINAIDPRHPKGRMITTLIRRRIGLITAHTNADIPAGGVADSLAAALGLSETRPLRPDPNDAAAGLGRVGTVAVTTVRGFAERVATALPTTTSGVRVAGDPYRPVRTVALQGGAGDDLLDAARHSGADVYLTSDLRHHPASEAVAWDDAPALIDVPHWAAEWTWLPRLADELADRLDGMSITVSELNTDPWDFSVR